MAAWMTRCRLLLQKLTSHISEVSNQSNYKLNFGLMQFPYIWTQNVCKFQQNLSECSFFCWFGMEWPYIVPKFLVVSSAMEFSLAFQTYRDLVATNRLVSEIIWTMYLYYLGTPVKGLLHNCLNSLFTIIRLRLKCSSVMLIFLYLYICRGRTDMEHITRQ